MDEQKYINSVKILRENLKSYMDFPIKGIEFLDVFSLLHSPSLTKELVQCLIYKVEKHGKDVDVFVGLDARGFLFGSLLAYHFEKPFVPIRKKGKLPGDVESVSYTLEYGTDTFEIQKGSVKPGQKVVIIDDLLATGGTLKAANDLVEKCGAQSSLNLIVIELVELNGRAKFTSPTEAVMQL